MFSMGTEPTDNALKLVDTEERSLIAQQPVAQPSNPAACWKIMLVDDDPLVHRATKVALKYFSFEDRSLSFVSAFSAKEAKQLIAAHPDTALILLDEVMETAHAGLEVANYIRNELKNKAVRIILRTGQPGRAPEESVVVDYDINDYKTKLELTQQKLFTTIVAGLRAYRDLKTLEQNQVALENLNAELTNFNSNLEQLVCDRTEQLSQEIEVREEAEAALKLYIHALTHDLRNPASGMTAVLRGLLKRQQTDGDSASVTIPVSMLERMTAGCERQLKMIDALLETHKAELWGISLRPQPVALETLIADVLKEWQPAFEQYRVSTNSQISPNLPSISGDRHQLWRVFENLIDNALKYNAPGLSLTIQVELDAAQHLILCTVQDNGKGIAPHLLDTLFERYHRGGAASPVQGLGLGLYICRQIVEAHGGTIGYKRSLNKGALFWFTLAVDE